MLDLHVIDQIPFESFEQASRYTLRYLHQKYGFGAWMLTRKNEDDWVILQIESDKYQIDELSTLVWSDSICSRMVKGKGPRWAPAIHNVVDYQLAPISKQLNIRSYVGIPICYSDGQLFGTLCAIDTEDHERIPYDGLATVELISKLLSSLLRLEIERNEFSSRQMQFLPNQFKDAETGFFNRLGWSTFLEKEQSDVRALGVPLYVMVIDATLSFNDGTRQHKKDLYAIYELLKSYKSESGYIARLSESIFTVLLHNLNSSEFEQLYHDTCRKVVDTGLKVQIGYKKHQYNAELDDTVMEALKAAHSTNV